MQRNSATFYHFLSRLDTGENSIRFPFAWSIFKINVHWQCCKWEPLHSSTCSPSPRLCQASTDVLRSGDSVSKWPGLPESSPIPRHLQTLVSEATVIFRGCFFKVWLCCIQILFFILYSNNHSWGRELQEFKLPPYKMLEESRGTFRTWVNWSQLETEYRRWIFSWRGANNSW